jgi:hypothetical protein
MPRKPEPWYWVPRRLWCVNISRKRHILGEHPKGAKKPQEKNGKWNVPKEIQDEYTS